MPAIPAVEPPAALRPSRRRVLDALSHREPDCVPVDFGSTSVTGIHVRVVAELREYYGLERRPVKVIEPYQMLGAIDEDLKTRLGADVEGVFRRTSKFGFPLADWKPWNFNGLEVLVPGQFQVTTDARGDTLIHPQGDTSVSPSGRMPKGFHFFDTIVRQNHFDPDHLNVEDNLEEFGPIREEAIVEIAEDIRTAKATGRAVLLILSGTALGDISGVPAPGLKHPKGIRDITEWYVSIKSRPETIHAIFERQTEIALENLERISRGIDVDSVDVAYICGTDFGTQTSAFCSVATFRDLWLPYYKRICGWIHEHTPWRCFKHSCGSVERFFESFLDAGFDIVNPVQCSAAGMAPERLKAKYGERLTFWGGGVDTQKTLPFGTPGQVRDEVLRRCEIFAPGGGFVFNAIHNIQAGTPVANIVAMVDAVREFHGRK